MFKRFYSYGVIKKEIVEDILERRRNGEYLDELVDEFSFLTRTQINNIIAKIEQDQ